MHSHIYLKDKHIMLIHCMIETFVSSLQNELRQTVDKMADKLEKETKANEEAAKRIEELTAQVNELNNKVCV